MTNSAQEGVEESGFRVIVSVWCCFTWLKRLCVNWWCLIVLLLSACGFLLVFVCVLYIAFDWVFLFDPDIF